VTENFVRTFKPRRRRVTPGQRSLMARMAGRHMLEETGPVLDFTAVFGRSSPVVLEIGYGYGDATVELARVEPDVDAIGVDVHTPGTASVLRLVEQEQLTNLRLVEGDATLFVDRISSGSLAAIRVWFPDPWPKRHQQQRRIIRPDIVAVLADRLSPGGVLHLATDMDDYARSMRAVCDAEPLLAPTDVPRRPTTKFETKGLEAGRASTDLAYRRIG
jgi:tRNA (guanine-N7-)-methyltransferase